MLYNPRLVAVVVIDLFVVYTLLNSLIVIYLFFYSYKYSRKSVVVSPSNLLSSPPIPSPLPPPPPPLVVEEDESEWVERGMEVSIVSGLSEEVSHKSARD